MVDSKSGAGEPTAVSLWTLLGGLIVVLGGGLSLLAIFADGDTFTSCFARLDQLPPLTSSLAHPLRLQLGDFSFQYEANERLVILHSASKRVVYSTPAGRAFLTAGYGFFAASNAHEGGCFLVQDSVYHLSNGTQISDMSKDDAQNTITISGTLSFAHGIPSAEFLLTYSLIGDRRIRFQVRVQHTGHGQLHVYLSHESRPEEHFYGFGAQYTRLDLKGRCVPVLSSEQGVGRGLQPLSFILNAYMPGSGGSAQTTYTAVPHYLTSDMHSMFTENTEFTVYDLSDPRRVTIEVVPVNMPVEGQAVISGQLIAGDNPVDLIREYTKYSGRMRALPNWAHSGGAIVGLQGGTDTVVAKLKVLEDAQVPIAALWVQDWTGPVYTDFGKRLFWNWELNHTHYPRWKEFVTSLAAKGIRVMTYINPYLSTRGPLFAEAEGRECLIRVREEQESGGLRALIQSSATPDFTFGTVDLTNPACQEWYIGVMQRNMLDTGASGWMADFAEMLPMHEQLHVHNGTAATLHNQFPALWAETCHKAIAKTPEHAADVVFFTRSGSATSPRYSSLQWMGDQLVTWDEHDGLASALTGQLSIGLSGYTFTHSDVGGYTMLRHGPIRYSRSKELLMRWMELSAFADAVFRSHEGNRPDFSAQVYDDENSARMFGYFASIHRALAPYRSVLIQQSQENGLPLTRPLFIHYPSDTTVQSMKTQFLLGEDLLVCPVLHPNAVKVSCYLPRVHQRDGDGDVEESWVYLWSDPDNEQIFRTNTTNGLWVTCSTPIGKPCVFFRSTAERSPDIRTAITDVRLQSTATLPITGLLTTLARGLPTGAFMSSAERVEL